MPEFLDADVVIRYLTDDPPDLGERAAALIEGEVQLTLSPLILTEVASVLTGVYRRERALVVSALIDLIQRENLSVHGVATEVAMEALELCRSSERVDFADALLWAEARSTNGSVHSFAATFPDEGIELRRP